MLIVAKRMRDLIFGKLMEVYCEENLEKGREYWREEPSARQIALAEQDFYQYLQEVFFRTAGACYLIWEERGRYCSALRLEPYRDGFLLAALETHPEMRNRGYGKKIVQEALREMGNIKVYSHINKNNTASLRTHEACGFERILEYAAYADGSVDDRCCTFRYCK